MSKADQFITRFNGILGEASIDNMIDNSREEVDEKRLALLTVAVFSGFQKFFTKTDIDEAIETAIRRKNLVATDDVIKKAKARAIKALAELGY